MITIRPALLDDAPAMARVLVDTWFAAHQTQVSEEVFERRRNEWGYTESEMGWKRSIGEADGVAAQVLVATDDEQIIGTAAGESISASCAEVTALYVTVAHQRSGVGRNLLAAMINHYRAIGMPTLQVSVLAANHPARRFYERVGFQTSATRDHEDGRLIVYALDLSADRAG